MTKDRAPAPGGKAARRPAGLGQRPLDASASGTPTGYRAGLGVGVSRRAQQHLFQVLPDWRRLGRGTHDGQQTSVEAGVEAAFGPCEALSDAGLGWGLFGQDGQQHLVLGRSQRVGGYPDAADGIADEFRIEFGGGVVQPLHQAAGP